MKTQLSYLKWGLFKAYPWKLIRQVSKQEGFKYDAY